MEAYIESLDKTLQAVRKEVINASAKHRPMAGRHEAYAVILEELDEYWDEVKKNPKKMSDGSRELWVGDMRTELVQTAAMAVRAIIDTIEGGKL